MLKNNNVSVGNKVIITAQYLPTYNKIGFIVNVYSNRYKILFKDKSIDFCHYRHEFKLIGNAAAFQDTVLCKWCNVKNKLYLLDCKCCSICFYYCPKCLR